MRLGEQILFLRKNKGITQEQLAQILGVTNQAVSKWESGQCLPDILLIPEIAEYFNVSIDELMGVSNVNHEEDLLIHIKNYISGKEPETQYAKVMEIAHALHAIVWAREVSDKFTCTEETMEHAICGEWGFSDVVLPQITTTMRNSSVFFTDNRNLRMDSNHIEKLSGLLKILTDRWTLSVLFAVYELTSLDESRYVTCEELVNRCYLREGVVKEIVQDSLNEYMEIRSLGDSFECRIKFEYMNIPPILSVLLP